MVKDYEYLGLVMKENGAINIMTLASQANKALFSLKRVLQNSKYRNLSIACLFLDSLVRPILDYGCEVWGFSPGESTEVIHRNFCN